MTDLKNLSLKKGRYRIVMMSCGYVENNLTSWLIFSTFANDERFDTAAQAVMELALDLHAKYEDEYLSHRVYSECCKKAQEDPAMSFCPKCGSRLQNIDFDGMSFMDFIVNLHSTTCDSYGESESTGKRAFAFWPWRAHELVGAGEDEIVYIGENAERVILDALYESRDDLRKLELDGNYEDDEEWRNLDWIAVRKRGTNYSV